MTEPHKDAIGNCTCRTCPYFHVPVPAPVGLCIRNPPVPFIIGMAPAGPVIDPTKPPQMQPIVRSYFPTVEEGAGCGHHPERAENQAKMFFTGPRH